MTTSDQSSIVLNSPRFPAGYPHEIYCMWIIDAPLGFNIKLEINQLFLAGDDIVILFDGTVQRYDNFVRLESRAPDFVGFVNNKASVTMDFTIGSYFSLTIDEFNITG